MKTKISRNAAQQKMKDFFEKEDLGREEMKKIKRFAMKYRIKLGDYRRKFCKKCLSKLQGKTRVGREYKSVTCKECGHLSRFRIQRN